MKTEAWVLTKENEKNKFIKKQIEVDDLKKNEILLKPLYGCLEGNMVHALTNEPIDILKEREENEIILGNAGVMEVEDIGEFGKEKFKKGDKVIYFCNGEQDEYGYPLKITGYDKRFSMGVLSKIIKLKQNEVIKIPDNDKISLQQWAAFSLKYITAWSNWNVAYNSWKIQMPNIPDNQIFVFGWGRWCYICRIIISKKNGM